MPDCGDERDHRCAKTPPPEQSTGLLGPAPLVESLLLDGPLGKGFRLESVVRDRYPALDRSAVPAPCDALLGALDGGELLAEVGREGDGDRLRCERCRRLRYSPVCWRSRDPSARILPPSSASMDSTRARSQATMFTGPWLVHDDLLAGSTWLLAWSRRNSPPIPGKHFRHLSNGAVAVPVTRM